MQNIKDFPKNIPVFPLRGAVFFPKTNLPLNIFEERYLQMVKDALKNNRLIGMIQSKEIGGSLFKIGCLGKISDHSETGDGRILINLLGLTRFRILDEIKTDKLYRQFVVKYDDYKSDLLDTKINNNLLKILNSNTRDFFEKKGLIINWNELTKLKIPQQIYTLIMISPISVSEKQKLLETISLEETVKTLSEIIKLNLYDSVSEKNLLQ
tara:strand:- start:2379 stop:3008 length:630 start_codon:yes stop_codon:yes gene_type:complete